MRGEEEIKAKFNKSEGKQRKFKNFKAKSMSSREESDSWKIKMNLWKLKTKSSNKTTTKLINLKSKIFPKPNKSMI